MFGTFVLTAIVLVTQGNQVWVAFAVLFLVMSVGRLSGNHLNPAVTIALIVTKQITAMRGAFYIVAQFFGAMLGLVVINSFLTSAPVDALTGQAQEVFKLPALTGDTWRPFFAEALGALIFGFGIAATFINKKEGVEAAFTVGGSLLLGLLVSSLALGAGTVLNPAVTLGLSGYTWDNMNTFYVFALGPIVGLAVGAWLYKLLLWDVEGRTK